jgi:hypothetical protein
MMLPKIGTIWRCKVPGIGYGDIQKVIAVYDARTYSELKEPEIVTISHTNAAEQIEFSGLWPAHMWANNFELRSLS